MRSVGQNQSRLDVQFNWEAATTLLSTLRTLMTTLENRFQRVEVLQEDAATQADDLVNVGLARINEVLLPSVLRIQKLTSLGFLLAHSDSSVKLELAQKTFIIEEGDERDLFTPSGYVTIERVSDYTTRAVAQVISYDNTLGFLSVIIVAAFGAPGPFTDWVISASPGVSEATRANMTAAAASAASALASAHQSDLDAAATAADRAATHLDAVAADLSAQAAAASQAAVNPDALLLKAQNTAMALALALS